MQSAALYVTAVYCAESTEDHDKKQYFLGVRDAFEAVYRACHDIPNEVDSYVAARAYLETLSEEDRVDLLTMAQKVIYSRRSESLGDASVTTIT